jgi:hypothetical protein
MIEVSDEGSKIEGKIEQLSKKLKSFIILSEIIGKEGTD